jgi:glycylpeptide N-tetradecanoyltransferase
MALQQADAMRPGLRCRNQESKKMDEASAAGTESASGIALAAELAAVKVGEGGEEKKLSRNAKKKKKKKAKGKGADSQAGAGGAGGDDGDVEEVGEELQGTATDLGTDKDKEKLIQALMGQMGMGAGKDDSVHKFWDTQPVPKMGTNVSELLGSAADSSAEVGKQLDQEKTVKDIRNEPYSMVGGFEWCTLDVNQDAHLDEMYVLLTENYVEDDDNMFRFDYSKAFLRWALQPPHYLPEWHVGVRATKSGKLMAMITGVPALMHAYDARMKMAEINFLCIHKKLRTKRLAPVLIKEVTRRINLTGVFQAVYTAGVVLPKPVSSCRYYHRSINPKKLIEVGFSRLAPRMTMARTIKLFKMPDEPEIPGIRPMVEADIPSACKLLDNYLKK